MKTILYNTFTNTVLSWHENGYMVDGRPVTLASPVVELNVIDILPPLVSVNQSISSKWVVDLEQGEYRIEWIINTIPEPSIEEYNAQMKQLRAEAYKVESDPLALKYLRDECTKQDWLDKIEEIRNRYQYKSE